MGKKGAKLSGEAETAAASLVEKLSELGDVSSRKMFGGLGVFESGTMFAIVDSAGSVFLRAGDTNQAMFESAGSERHGKMPYYGVPDAVLDEAEQLVTWARSAVEVSRAAKK